MKKSIVLNSIVIIAILAITIAGVSASQCKHGHHNKLDKMDVDKSGMVDRTEFAQHIEKMFMKMDKNNDAVLNEQDSDESKRHKRHHKWIKDADINGDKEVSNTEFKEFMEQRFNDKDSNNDNLISNEEMEVWQKNHRQEMKKKKFMRLDKNGDGVISEDEFFQHNKH